ncbi:T-complex protein 1 [Nadsonia fulvescens var. elongata DSM 6958]|uniref:T-complex protein 1 n=1 Tax=Nadsonia fulvescens var. elongata DSM 6958 TaxID=857566 RepID=A0A1E3PNK8_9ASCO|nr:T-complex protein 1 [Nadsonia fulvescens var. elongata DSM 6958]
MSLKLPSAPNTGLFKPGYQTQSSEDGAVVRNITACREISQMVRTSVGPCGRNKIIVNHLGKVFLTSDAATILKELDIVHPAAKLMVMASQQQEAEMGDATNLVIILAGELLNQAENLIRLGLHPSEIIQGYEVAKKHALEVLQECNVDEINSFDTVEELNKAVKSAIASKQYGNEEILSNLVSEAILHVLPKHMSNFNVDNIRVVKVMGSSLESSTVIKGMVFGREPETLVKSVVKSKVAVFTCPVDITSTETSGTVLLHNAKEMLDFSKGEEAQMEAIIKELFDAGVRVIIAGAGLGELALHYLNRYGILAIKLNSKFDLRRLCRVVGATPLARLGAPMPEEMGVVDVVETIEIGGDRVTVFRQENETTKTATIVVRGATQNSLDDIERAIDDGVNVIKSLSKDKRLLPGAGAIEAELVEKIVGYGERTPGLLQHAIKKYGEAFEIIPRTLAENAGLDATEVLSRLYAAHSKGTLEGLCVGVDVDDNDGTGVVDAKQAGIYDLLSAKASAIGLATDAATTILSVDQIIMAKRAGGPVMPQQGSGKGNWDQDD